MPAQIMLFPSLEHNSSKGSAPGEILCSLIVMQQPIRGGMLMLDIWTLRCCSIMLCCNGTAACLETVDTIAATHQI